MTTVKSEMMKEAESKERWRVGRKEAEKNKVIKEARHGHE